MARIYTKQQEIRKEDPEALFLNAGLKILTNHVIINKSKQIKLVIQY